MSRGNAILKFHPFARSARSS